MVVGDPFEKGARFGKLVLRNDLGAAFEILEGVVDLAEDRLPVLDGGAHIGEGAFELVSDLIEASGIALPIHLDMHEALGLAVGRTDGGQHMLVGCASTGRTGWMTRWMINPSRLIAMVIESTRNGMSSVTISIVVWVDCQPCCSICGL